jgi:hypothetical protein
LHLLTLTVSLEKPRHNTASDESLRKTKPTIDNLQSFLNYAVSHCKALTLTLLSVTAGLFSADSRTVAVRLARDPLVLFTA